MPKLPTYTADLSRGGAVSLPRATAQAFGGGVAEGIGDLATTARKAADTYLTELEETESRKVLVHNTEVRAKYAKRLDEAATSGEDLDKIREEFDNDLDAVQGNLQTRRGAQTADYYAASSRQIFQGRENDIQVYRAASEAKLEGSKLLNNLGEIINNNVSYLPQAKADVDAFVSTLTKVSPQRRAEIAEDLKANLNVHAAKTSARLMPEETIRRVQGGEFDLTPQQTREVVAEANAAISLRHSRKLMAEQEFKLEQSKRADETLNEMLTAYADGNLARYNTNELMRRQDLDPDRKLQIMNIYNALALRPKTDPIAANALYADIFRPEGDPRRVNNVEQIDARLVRGVIDPEEHRRQRAAFANREKPETQLENHFLSRAESVINPRDALGRILAPDGPMNAHMFRRDVMTLREQWVKDKKSPESLFDPSSKEYRENVLPLLNKYRATSIYVPDEKGGMRQERVPTPDDAIPLIRSKAEFDALKPGEKFREPGDPAGKFRVKPALAPGGAPPGKPVTGEIRR